MKMILNLISIYEYWSNENQEINEHLLLFILSVYTSKGLKHWAKWQSDFSTVLGRSLLTPPEKMLFELSFSDNW